MYEKSFHGTFFHVLLVGKKHFSVLDFPLNVTKIIKIKVNLILGLFRFLIDSKNSFALFMSFVREFRAEMTFCESFWKDGH